MGTGAGGALTELFTCVSTDLQVMPAHTCICWVALAARQGFPCIFTSKHSPGFVPPTPSNLVNQESLLQMACDPDGSISLIDSEIKLLNLAASQ